MPYYLYTILLIKTEKNSIYAKHCAFKDKFEIIIHTTAIFLPQCIN